MVGKSNLKFKEWKHVKHVFISNQIGKFTLNLWRLILSQTPDCHSAQPMWNPGDSHQPSFNLGDSGNKNYFWFSAETVWYCWYSWDSRAQIRKVAKGLHVMNIRYFLWNNKLVHYLLGIQKVKKNIPKSLSLKVMNLWIWQFFWPLIQRKRHFKNLTCVVSYGGSVPTPGSFQNSSRFATTEKLKICWHLYFKSNSLIFSFAHPNQFLSDSMWSSNFDNMTQTSDLLSNCNFIFWRPLFPERPT